MGAYCADRNKKEKGGIEKPLGKDKDFESEDKANWQEKRYIRELHTGEIEAGKSEYHNFLKKVLSC
jgi:hypothetical protein